MRVDVEFPAHEVDRWVADVFADQMPFATSLAINNVAKAFQADQRLHMANVFEIRRPTFMRRSVKIKPFATKVSPEAKVAIDSPADRSDIFGKFEDQTSKSPLRGRSVAVPTEHVPRTGAGIIKKAWRPSHLLADASQHDTGRVFRRKGNVYRGRKRTLLIRRPGGRGTIFQRTDEGLVPLYQLVPVVRIRPELRFIENAGQAIDREWVRQFTAAFDRATRTARR